MSHLHDKIIEINFSKEGSWQHISMRDYGTGIANLDNVFVTFYLDLVLWECNFLLLG
jgi:hypothetical protein